MGALDAVFAQMRECQKCGLRTGCKQVVPGEGPDNATVLFIGEGPGETEDESGRPFVGRAGKMLRETLRYKGIKENEVFIKNIVSCRPPNNREPEPLEIEACWDWTLQVLNIVKPKVVVTLGGPAIYTMAQKFHFSKKIGNNKITALAGKPIYLEDRHFYVYPVFHPSYACRRSDARAAFGAQLAYLSTAIPQWLERP